MTKKYQKKLKPNVMVELTHQITISTVFNTKNLDALQTLRIDRSRP